MLRIWAMDPDESARLRFYRPRGVLSGFDATLPDPSVPEVVHAGEQWLPTEYPIGRHAHEVSEFYYQIDGVSLWQSGATLHELRAKQLFLVPPHVEHSLVNRATGEHHFFFAAIDVQRVLSRVPEVAAQYQSDACRSVARAESLEAPFRQFMREVTTQGPFHAQGLRAAVDALVIEAARLLFGGSSQGLVALHPGVIAVRDALDHHPGEPWTLPVLSKLAGLSPNHLTALFKRDTGVSPHQYLLRERIRRAKEVLAGTDTPITQVALELGFSSSQHFAKMFKQVVGTTALAYRRKSHVEPPLSASDPQSS
ncbi:MAG TPA: AraC family transcriptional regulator [Polyangiaceae bacterium]|nr:AraC family transcriptional regulator [Polyangiaceae bacterium]